VVRGLVFGGPRRCAWRSAVSSCSREMERQREIKLNASE
jgi:hypothetical protein